MISFDNDLENDHSGNIALSVMMYRRDQLYHTAIQDN